MQILIIETFFWGGGTWKPLLYWNCYLLTAFHLSVYYVRLHFVNPFKYKYVMMMTNLTLCNCAVLALQGLVLCVSEIRLNVIVEIVREVM